MRDLDGHHGRDLAAVLAGIVMGRIVDVQREAVGDLDARIGRHFDLARRQDGDAALPGDNEIPCGNGATRV